ncbi:cora-like Mg2+ transporter protein-domain-containing protein [Mariannaea sp. PMI_226]|nr:cora-like Mg2+ transporter protein-domain-containing protein [Mariannaea sp. PMI_226]
MTTPAPYQLTQHTIDDLIRAAEVHHEQYVRTLRTLHDGLALRRIDSQPRSVITIPEPFTPPLRALSVPTLGTDMGMLMRRRARASTLETTAERPSLTPELRPLANSPRSHISNAVFSNDDDLPFIPLLDPASVMSAGGRHFDDETAIPTRQPLTPMHWTDEMLMSHLHDTEFTPDMEKVLEDVIKRRDEMDHALSFRDFATYEREGYVQSTFEVYEVGPDSMPLKLSEDPDVDLDGPTEVKYAGSGPYENPPLIVDAPTVWEAIRGVNPDTQSVGRITIVQEPTPLILAALHLTMSPHFDMTELLDNLISDRPNRGRTLAFMNRAFERAPSAQASSSSTSSSPIVLPVGVTPPQSHPHPPLRALSSLSAAHVRQRSFFFVFKYYTVVGTGLTPAPWQRFDNRPLDKRIDDHIDIAECGSILALSLGGDPIKPVRMRPRRERVREGFLFDTFGPWHLLSIQSFPDNAHTVRGDEFQAKQLVNGPCAFLELLIAEYRDAGKRNQNLHELITKLITAKTEFMFDPKVRDKLLFEDKHFTYIRRYFWAYNTLAVVNTSIKAMMSAYVDTFTDEFWAGNHPILWPHSEPESLAGVAYREHMNTLRRELDKVVRELGEVLKRNERTRKEIENLRDQLFSGSSIKESRRAIEQGDNIQILTLISMIFLPLTFVTSVFGMTEFTIPATDWRFPVTMVLVCVPFMLLILLLQTRSFALVVAKLGTAVTIPAKRTISFLRRASRDPEIPDNRSTLGPSQRRMQFRRGERWSWHLGMRGKPADEEPDLGRGERV